MSESELRNWLVKTVQTVENVKSIHVSYNYNNCQPHSGFHLDLMDYLSFKFPNTETVHISRHSQDEQCISHFLKMQTLMLLHKLMTHGKVRTTQSPFVMITCQVSAE